MRRKDGELDRRSRAYKRTQTLGYQLGGSLGYYAWKLLRPLGVIVALFVFVVCANMFNLGKHDSVPLAQQQPETVKPQPHRIESEYKGNSIARVESAAKVETPFQEPAPPITPASPAPAVALTQPSPEAPALPEIALPGPTPSTEANPELRKAISLLITSSLSFDSEGVCRNTWFSSSENQVVFCAAQGVVAQVARADTLCRKTFKISAEDVITRSSADDEILRNFITLQGQLGEYQQLLEALKAINPETLVISDADDAWEMPISGLPLPLKFIKRNGKWWNSGVDEAQMIAAAPLTQRLCACAKALKAWNDKIESGAFRGQHDAARAFNTALRPLLESPN